MSTNKRLIDLGNPKSRFLTLPVIVGGLLLCLMGSMVLHGWSQNNSFVPAIQVLLGTAEGGAAGEVISQGDITLYVPPNATDQPGTFSIAAASPDVSLISNDTEWIRPKVVNVEFWQPNGVQVSNISFSEPIEICFGMAEEQWQAFLAQPEAFEVQHYLDKQDPPVWEVLPQITYPERLQLCGQTSELSAFALAIKVEAEVPVTGATAAATLVPTRTRVSAVQTYERNRDGASSESSLSPGSTNPTSTNAPAATRIEPTNTPTLRPTNTLRPPDTATLGPTNTNTPRPPTRTPRPPSLTPTDTKEPFTNTPRPPTGTDNPPSPTPRPPTATPRPPTATDNPPTQPPPTDPPPTNPPPTNPPPTDPPPTDPPPTDPPPTDPPTEEPTPGP